MRYGYIASMKARPNRREDVIEFLLKGVEELRSAGCETYLVSRSATQQDTIWVFEVWQSKEHHAASLELPQVRAAIATAMPMLTGEFTGQELSVAGGLGVHL